MPTVYTSGFYDSYRDASLKSARKIVPHALRFSGAKSVADVGCGVGTWLRVVKDSGITDYLGVDGDYVEKHMLEIEPDRFRPHDLQQAFRADRRFDLVLSMEVAEHLPPDRANTFIDTLTSLGDVVLFSAAIPFQNGTNHVNEQFPDYWKDRFRERGYVVVDCLRKLVWNDPDVEPWYAQNALFFVKEERLNEYPHLAAARATTDESFLALVHPKIYLLAREDAAQKVTLATQLDNTSLPQILSQLPGRFMRAVTRRFTRVNKVSL